MSAAADIELAAMLWNIGEHAEPARFRRFARAAERSGFDAIAAGDHVAFPETIPDEYPFSHSGSPPPSIHSEGDLYNVFELLTFVAAITDEISVKTAACIPALRHPVVVTKNAFTLEALSEGRLDFGVATGWMDTQFEILGVPPRERGPRLDEFLEIFDRARETGKVVFDGEYYSFDSVNFHPYPDRELPVWIGGNSGAAIRRTAEYGDGIIGVGQLPGDATSFRSRIMNAWTDFDREGEPAIAVMRPFHVGTDTRYHDPERPLVGDPESVAADLEAYAEAGVDRLILTFFEHSVDYEVGQMRSIGDEVLPLL